MRIINIEFKQDIIDIFNIFIGGSFIEWDAFVSINGKIRSFRKLKKLNLDLRDTRWLKIPYDLGGFKEYYFTNKG